MTIHLGFNTSSPATSRAGHPVFCKVRNVAVFCSAGVSKSRTIITRLSKVALYADASKPFETGDHLVWALLQSCQRAGRLSC